MQKMTVDKVVIQHARVMKRGKQDKALKQGKAKAIIQKGLKAILVVVLAFPVMIAGCSNQSKTLYPAVDGQTFMMGFIDSSGKWVIQPSFQEVRPFSEGYAWVKTDGGDVFIDQRGNTAIKLEGIRVNGDFSDGMAVAYDSETSLYGYINTKGKWVIKPQYTQANSFTNGYASVVFGDDTWTGIIIDKSGKEILRIPDEYLPVLGVTKDGTFIAISVQNGTARTYDLQGNLIHEDPWPGGHLSSFSEGLKSVKDQNTGLFGFIDKNSDWVISAQFSFAYNFKEGLSAAQDPRSGQGGYIDKKGNWVIQPRFEDCLNFKNNLAFVYSKTNGKWGVIDKSGNWTISPFTDMIHPSSVSSYVVNELNIRTSSLNATYGQYMGVFNGELALIVVPDGDYSVEFRYIDKQGKTVYNWFLS